jgi:phosphohistidine swiveling domain-containing protein
LLQNPQAPYVDKLFQSQQQAYALYQDYLRQFGDRSIGELKLESPSVRDNPTLLLVTIATVASVCAQPLKTKLSLVTSNTVEVPQDEKVAQTTIRSSTPVSFLVSFLVSFVESFLVSFLESLLNPAVVIKRLVLSYISERTRHLIAGRENLRFARTRVFGLVRDIMLAMADKLVAKNLLDIRQDIFYLEVEEVLGFVEGCSTCKNLRALVALRLAEEKTYLKVIPDRVPCAGPVGLVSPSSMMQEQELEETSNGQPGPLFVRSASHQQIKGLPASSGKISGLARVIKDPASEHLLPGEILVAERTDPGWIMHFALCQGIVTSYGSMLSHTAIVARELKIPAVVAAKGATELIGTGDLIEVDGSAGLVTIIKRAVKESWPELGVTKDCA